MLVKANTGKVQSAFASASMDPLPYGIIFVLVTIISLGLALNGLAAVIFSGIAASLIEQALAAAGAAAVPVMISGFKWGSAATIEGSTSYAARATKAYNALSKTRQGIALSVVKKVYELEDSLKESNSTEVKKAIDERVEMLERLVKEDADERAAGVTSDDSDVWTMRQVLEEIDIRKEIEAQAEAAKQAVLDAAENDRKQKKALEAPKKAWDADFLSSTRSKVPARRKTHA